ncbi:MAG: hypothetical protein ACP5G5_06985 [Thermoplasmata archaeon]
MIDSLEKRIEELENKIEEKSKKYDEVLKTVSLLTEFLKTTAIPEIETKIKEIEKKLDYLNKLMDETIFSLATKFPELKKNVDASNLQTPAPSVQPQAPAQPKEPVSPPAPGPGAVQGPAGAVKSQPVQQSTPAQSEVEVQFRDIVYVALLEGRDERYGFKRKFLSEKGAKDYRGRLRIGSYIEVKNSAGRKLMKITEKGPVEIKEGDLKW